MRVVTIGGATLVAGLKWRMRDGLSRNEICADIRADGSADRICLLEEMHGSVDSGRMKGKPLSLAALYALSCNDRTSVFTFTDDDGAVFHWVAGIRNRRLSLRSDIVFENGADAGAFRASLQESLGLDDAETLDEEESRARIASFLADRQNRRAARLLLVNDLTAGRLLLGLAGIAGCLCLLYGGYAGYQQYARHQLQVQAEARKSRAEAQVQDVLDHPERYFAAKWQTAAPARFTIIHGLEALMRTPLAANGWKMASTSISGTTHSTRWEITPFGDFSHLPDNAVLDAKSVSKAASTEKLQLQFPESPRQELLSVDEASRRIYDVTHAFSLNSSLKFGKRQVKTVQKVRIECPWMIANVKFEKIPAVLAANAMPLAKALDIPGLVINEISYGDGSWSLKGELYAKAN